MKCYTNHHFQEETDWEGGSNDADDSEDDDDDDDEEIKAGTSGLRPAGGTDSGREVFPVLAPPEQFQNCLSPSATYEVRSDQSLSPSETSDLIFSQSPGRLSVASPAYSNDSVSSMMSSSTTTEKSVRFSDRDLILSTPGNLPAPPRLSPILYLHFICTEPGGAPSWPFRSDQSDHPVRTDRHELLPIKVKSILKSEQPSVYSKNYNGGGSRSTIPDVTSFFLDKEDGTLV